MPDHRAKQSDFMHWAKFKQPVRFALTGSEVPHFRMDSLPISLADLDLDGASHARYASLRDAVANRHQVSPDQVVAADGTSMANFLAMATIVSPGDEVLIERPTYEPLVRAASFLGAQVTRFDRNPSDDFALDPGLVQLAMTERTKLIVVTNLHNPSCALAGEEALQAIGDLASARGARILIDEVYLDSAAAPQRSAVHLGSEFIATSSLTKAYGLSGLRCGWVLAEPDLAERMWRLNDLFGVNQAHQAERLACIAFERLNDISRSTPALLAGNRALFNDFVAARDDVECMPARHGVTAFPRWSGGDSDRLDTLLRERFDTAVVPGRWFEMPDRFRIGLGYPQDHFREGLARLGQALDELK
jgi:aspartate/methionine/tyrosine aminotransferase